ncbi:hypothetical protein HY745_15055, partial [Candidatus Desantisbacteria bacterium]|nr:hypothetical protein [Candidatus Desantisbacteria bacterium]
MKLQKIDSMIELCKNHLDNTKTKGTEIESILTKYLLVYICGVFETKIKEIFIQRASQTGDKQIESFVKNIIEQKNSFKI